GQVGAYDGQNALDPAVAKRADHALQHRPPTQRQGKLRPAHARALAARRNQRKRHGLACLTRSRTRASGIVAPRLRQAISSATMLTAISGTVCEPIAKPSGACTRARASSATPLA